MTLSITGSALSNTTSVTLPSHNVGDLIVIFAHARSTATAPSVPSAGGTVPAWNTIDTLSGSVAGSLVSAYFVATATNHTSGTWTGATGMVAVVVSGNLAASPIGGHAASNAGASTSSVTAPAVTLANSDGSSVLLHYYGHNSTVSAWGAAPAGYTRLQSATGNPACCNSKDDTTSDGSVNQSLTSTSTSNAAASVEILAAVAPSTQGNFFALF